MLSVLIPVFNWDISYLVKDVHQQCALLGIEFEIIALDDCSTHKSIQSKNSEIQLPHFTYIIGEKNVGNAEARNQLARKAKFDHLLFLDCDVLPVRDEFIKRYLEFLGESKVICGGIVYEDIVDSKYSLRWKFGRKHEVVTPMEAQQNPYLNIRGCNFFIPKCLFLAHPFTTLKASYGYVDTFFALSLQKAGVEAVHIDNPVYHLGLEENSVYIQKFHKSIINAKWLIEAHPELSDHLRLVTFYKKIKKFGLDKLVKVGFKLFEKPILNNLHSANPSLFLFQVYKLGYLCALKEA